MYSIIALGIFEMLERKPVFLRDLDPADLRPEDCETIEALCAFADEQTDPPTLTEKVRSAFMEALDAWDKEWHDTYASLL